MPNPIPPPTSNQQPWVPAADLACSPCNVDADLVALAATTLADNFSGNQFGLRELRLRPCALTASCGCDGWAAPGPFVPWFGWWSDLWWWWGGCGCGRPKEVRISEPVWSITSVKCDGAILDPTAWILYGDNRLVRVDGGGFPCCQPLSRDPDTTFGTLEIACTIGSPPDAMAVLAVQEIACELVRVFDDPAACRLPAKVQSVVRQQLTVQVLEPTPSLMEGFTGLPMVDLWLASLDAMTRRVPGRAVDLTRMTAWREPAS
jgi:hypothetical protein